MRCIVSTSMKRLLTLLGSMTVSMTFVQADCGTPTPPAQECPTQPQSVNYAVEGSCGNSGIITVLVPMADTCDISVIENENIGLPHTGTFAPSAAKTNYKLSEGGWTLQPPPSGMLGDNGGLDCSITSVTGNETTLKCSITVCSVVGDDDEPTCTFAGSCEAHLTPAPAGAMPDLDAGLSMDTASSADGG
jgi:hypothetical protein